MGFFTMIASDTDELDPVAFERLKRLGGVKLLREMIDLFLGHAPTRVEAALAAGAIGDITGVNRAVHSLKSSVANLGARGSRTEQIERVARRILISHGATASAMPSRAKERLEAERRGLANERIAVVETIRHRLLIRTPRG